jgi:Carboxypeptidase regulatory-like domain/TonB dependent receptor-like, beta-barrel
MPALSSRDLEHMHAFVLFIERNSFDASYGVHYDPSAIQVDLQLHAIDRDDSPGGARMRRIIGARLLASTVAVVMFGVWAGRVEAQAVYGSISGTIVDNTGAVLPGVTVTIVSVERKTSDEVVTNESGFYVKDRLLPGMYEVRAELSGFKQAVFSSIVVNVDTNTPLNIKLEIGQVAEQITVTGFSPLLRTDRADVATRFDEKQITDLPVLDRNFTKFVLLTPGTQQLGWQHAASENPQGSTQTMVNGQHFSGTTYQLDGTENRDPILGIIVINPTLESIKETKITSQNYDAEFGQATAGVVSVQTKSGTNELHGSAFEFFQSDKFQSRNPFTQFQVDPVTGRILPETKRNQFGASVGGKIVENKWFFFGDYEGTRSTVGGSRLVTVPTAAARAGDFSAYGVNIYDPATGPPTVRRQFPNNQIPGARLSPQALALLELIPLPNVPGRENGTIDNYAASGSETFDANSFNVRIDGRLRDGLNTFGRYSLGDFLRDGPQAFGTGGGDELVTLGGVSDARNQSIAYGIDYALSSSLLADFRFGWFKYRVNVLPSDFGTTPAADAGIPGLNVDNTLASGLPAVFIAGDTDSRRIAFGSGLGDRVGRCNCPLDEDEQQFQVVGNVTKLWRDHSFKFGIDVRRAYNWRLPSDRHRSGELNFENDRTRGPSGGGLALASFMLGDVTRFTRYVSATTDARERQWRHYYYAQDVWRPTQRLTLNYGLRLDIINPQTVNEAGNGGFLDLSTGLINVAGVGNIGLNGNVKNRLNWAPRLGVTYQLAERTVLRAGYGRSFDLGVFGSLFGHSVTQNLPVLSVQELNAPQNFESVFNLSQGPPAAVFPSVPSSGQFPLPNGVSARPLPDKQRPPRVDAFNVTVQHQLSDTISIEAAYVGNRGHNVFASGNPEEDVNQAVLTGFPTVPTNLRRPFFAGNVPNLSGFGGAFGWTQRIGYFCNCATNAYDSLQTKVTKRFGRGYSVHAAYTLQRAIEDNDDYFFFDPEMNRGPTDWDRTHNFTLSLVAELPFGRDRRYLKDISPTMDAIVGGWQFNTNTIIYSGVPFSVTYRDASADRDTGGNNRPNLIGDPDGPETQAQWFNATAIGSAGSAFERPARATFGTMPRNDLRGPGYWRVDASLFKHFRIGTRLLEARIEAVNLFNNVNLGNPDAEVGVPGNPNANAGRINSTAFGGSDLMRNFQFGLKFTF